MDGKYVVIRDDELYHHGILGQKWGVRRFQNADGSLTPAGLKRQARQAARAERRAERKTARAEAARKKAERQEEEKFIRDAHTKDPKKMSADELVRALDRLKKEGELRALQSPLGETTVKNIRAGAGDAIKSLTSTLLKNVGELAIDKVLPGVWKSNDQQQQNNGQQQQQQNNGQKQQNNGQKQQQQNNGQKQKQQQQNNGQKQKQKQQQQNNGQQQQQQNNGQKQQQNNGQKQQNSEAKPKVPSKPVTLKDLGIGDTSKLTLKDMTAAIDEYKKKNPGAVMHSDLIETSMDDFLSHSGKKGMKWGERNYEDYDGHLTAAGKARYLGKSSESGSDSGSSSKTDSPWGDAATKDYSGRAKGSKKKGKGGGKGGKGKKGSKSEKAAVEKKDWRDRFAEELKKASMTDEQLQEALDKLYPDRKKKIGVGQKTVKHSEEISMDDNTHFIIERDGEYLEHYGIKGMKWKKRKAKDDDSWRNNSNFSYKVEKAGMSRKRSSDRDIAVERESKPGRSSKNKWTAKRLNDYNTGRDNTAAEREASISGTLKDLDRYQSSKYRNKQDSGKTKTQKKKKSKASSWISSKVKDASITYDRSKSILKKLFGG